MLYFNTNVGATLLMLARRGCRASAPLLRLGSSAWPETPFPLVPANSLRSARSSPGREAAKRTLDGEDRSGIIEGEGKKRLTEGERLHRRSPLYTTVV